MILHVIILRKALEIDELRAGVKDSGPFIGYTSRDFSMHTHGLFKQAMVTTAQITSMPKQKPNPRQRFF